MKKVNFIDLMKRGTIRVPKIQREYAQGRPDAKAKAIRKHFVQDLFNAVLGTASESHLNLDLMYGLSSKETHERSVFLPIDGQQRLTTLYLLAWFCGIKMRDAEKSWAFDYKSRRIAQYFMDGLRDHPRQGEKPSIELIKSSWFHPSWKSDPSVSGMIEVLDEMFDQNKKAVVKLQQSVKLENVKFYVDDEICGKNLEEEEAEATYGHLFLKMNARGLLLTDWEVEKNEIDKHAENVSTWRGNINGTWQEKLSFVMPKTEQPKERIQLLDTAMSKIVGICSDICGKQKNQNYDEWLCELDEKKRKEFFEWCTDAFGRVQEIQEYWSQDRCKNGLWEVKHAEGLSTANEMDGVMSEKDKYANWLSGKNAVSPEQLLRFAFLIKWQKHLGVGVGLQMIPRRRIRILLNLLDNTNIDIKNKRELLKQGLDYLSDGDRKHLKGFHKEQLADEEWKARFDEVKIVEIERDPLIWRGSTAFLGARSPNEMDAALSQLRNAVQTDRKGLFLSLLGLSGKCNDRLACGSIRIPNEDKEWAEECFSVSHLFLRDGVDAWLSGRRYNADSGPSAWLNYLSALWDTVVKYGLGRIATKDAGWLFCIKKSNLTNEAIRMVRSNNECSILNLLEEVKMSDANVPYVTWDKLPYDGFMKAKEGWYFNVKRESWYNSSSPERYSRNSDGSFELMEENALR